jgi:hypothetical protein
MTGLYFVIVGYIIALGAVTVIDVHGLLGTRSGYWTESTIRAHKVTKPLISLGSLIKVIGDVMLFNHSETTRLLLFIDIPLMINGLFLIFYISPMLLKRERGGLIAKILPSNIQVIIAVSFIISFTLWWGSLLLALSQITLI